MKILGDMRGVVEQIKSNSIGCIITSPPFGWNNELEIGTPFPRLYMRFVGEFMRPLYRLLKYQHGQIFIHTQVLRTPDTPYYPVHHMVSRRVTLPLIQEIVIDRLSRHKEAFLHQSHQHCYNISERLLRFHVSPENARSYVDSGIDIWYHMDNTVQYHPTELPGSMLRALIQKFTAQDDIILDPFAGSCIVEKIAHELGRRAICIEKNPEHYQNSHVTSADQEMSDVFI